jgi:hypothetical protein
MFDFSDPRGWQNITNMLLLAVALVAAAYVAIGAYKQARSKSRKIAGSFGHEDPHTLVLPDLGITMADGGEKLEKKNN